MAISTYSPKDVDINIAGVAFPLDGWDSITVARNEDNTSKNISADGKLGLTMIADITGTLEIEVQQQNSAINSLFSAIQGAQDASNDVIPINFTLTDSSGGMLVTLFNSFLDKPSDMDYSKEAGSRTWMFYVESINYVPNPDGLTGAALLAAANAAAAVATLKTAAEAVVN